MLRKGVSGIGDYMEYPGIILNDEVEQLFIYVIFYAVRSPHYFRKMGFKIGNGCAINAFEMFFAV